MTDSQIGANMIEALQRRLDYGPLWSHGRRVARCFFSTIFRQAHVLAGKGYDGIT